MGKYYITDPYAKESKQSDIVIDGRSNYSTVINDAYQTRFGRDAIKYAEAKKDEDVVSQDENAEAAAVQEEVAEKAVVRKNKVAIIITMITALLAIAIAAISYVCIEALASYTAYYTESLQGLVAIFSDIGAQDILTIVTVALLLASILLALITFIRCIIILASKKKKKCAFICPLLFLLLIIASAVVFVIGLASFALDSIVTDIGIATIATAGLALISFIASIFSYKK